MKKLLLFLALWSGASSAMQADAVPADVASTIPAVQDQMNFIATMAEQASALTPVQREQAIAQAKENVQKLVDSCGGDKELLKTKLQQKIKSLLMHPIAGSLAITFYVCLELALEVAAFYGCLYGTNLLAILTTGKLLFTAYPSLSPIAFYFLIGSRIGFGLGYMNGYRDAKSHIAA